MGKETVKRILDVGCDDLEVQLALQCAPLITGLKVSNLLIVDNDKADEVRKMYGQTKISLYLICSTEDRSIFLLYDEAGLSAYLQDERVTKILFWKGYSQLNLEYVLNEFSKRYVGYLSGKKEFPHEMGVLLGYPPEDVYGFILNKGENYICSGYWKVYSNPDESKKLFERFNQAKELILQMVWNGMNMLEIINLYENKKAVI